MTRNPSEATHKSEAEADARAEAIRRHQEYLASPAGARHQRQPLNWPTAALGIVALLVLAFAAWVCSGAAVEIWGTG